MPLRTAISNRAITVEPSTSIKFSSGNDSITFPSINALKLTNSFTISYWVRCDSTVQNQKWLFRKDSTGNVGYANFFNYNTGFLEFNASGYTGSNPGYNSGNGKIPLSDFAWHHIVYTYDGVTFSGYKDKKLIFSTAITFSLAANNGTLCLGASTPGNNLFLGNLADFRILNVGVGQAQVELLYKRSTNVLTSNTVAWYKLDEGSGTVAVDSSSNASNGTITTALYEIEPAVYFPRKNKNLYCFGDSVTAGSAASDADHQYVTHVARNKRLIKVNEAVSGTVIQEQSSPVFGHKNTARPIENRDQILMYSGYNNMRTYGTNSTSLGYFQDNLYANIVWCAIQDRYKIYGQDTRGLVSYSGTWSNATTFPGIGKTSSTAGDTATFRVYGSVVYVCGLGIISGTGKFSLTIDGISQGTYNCYSAQTTGLNINDRPFLVRISGLSQDYHTVVFTVTVNSGVTTFMYATGNLGLNPGDEVQKSSSPNVYVSNIIYMTTAGYAVGGGTNNGSDAAVDLYNAVILNAVTTLYNDGLNVEFIDSNKEFIVTVDNFNADLVHPNDAGHQMLANAFNKVISPFIHKRRNR